MWIANNANKALWQCRSIVSLVWRMIHKYM